MTQKELVLDYMNKHGGITRKEAFDNLGIANLPARISELKHDGFIIHEIWITGKNRYGVKVRWKKYRLGRLEDYADGTV